MRNVLLMMDFVRHTHFKLSYGRWLNAVLLCPHYHQLHHSVARKHWDKNFGLTLSIWDRVFGTLVIPEPGEDFEFGLMHNEADEYQSLYRLHVLPLKKIGVLLRRGISVRRPRTVPNPRGTA
jgi:sterol desaturase/sphingolipid hydroxylase (fatty acid hydroxylase superfamily)